MPETDVFEINLAYAALRKANLWLQLFICCIFVVKGKRSRSGRFSKSRCLLWDMGGCSAPYKHLFLLVHC